MSRQTPKKLPFTFDDSSLIAYLKTAEIPYLGRDARRLIARLTRGQITGQRDTVRRLWSDILVDAIKTLKKNDPREYRPRSGIHFASFFNKDSLGKERIDEILDAFGDFEGMMYGSRPGRYRDHVLHSFRCWVIGHWLLTECLGGSLAIPECALLAGQPKKGERHSVVSPTEWSCIWAIAALCHDIGYPLQAVGNINDMAQEALRAQGLYAEGALRFVFSSQVQPLQDTVLKLMSSKLVRERVNSDVGEGRDLGKGCEARFLTHIQNKYYLKFLNSLDQLQHGVVSSLILGRSLVYFLESDLCQDPNQSLDVEDARQFLLRRETLRAIASHTCPEIYHLRFDTLSFLLFIVDEMQCWGRPTFDQLLSGSGAGKDATVRVKEFNANAIKIRVKLAGDWKGNQNWVKEQLKGIKQRLRLAVDARELADRSLTYEVATKDRRGLRLTLSNGRIAQDQVHDGR